MIESPGKRDRAALLRTASSIDRSVSLSLALSPSRRNRNSIHDSPDTKDAVRSPRRAALTANARRIGIHESRLTRATLFLFATFPPSQSPRKTLAARESGIPGDSRTRHVLMYSEASIRKYTYERKGVDTTRTKFWNTIPAPGRHRPEKDARADKLPTLSSLAIGGARRERKSSVTHSRSTVALI